MHHELFITTCMCLKSRTCSLMPCGSCAPRPNVALGPCAPRPNVALDLSAFKHLAAHFRNSRIRTIRNCHMQLLRSALHAPLACLRVPLRLKLSKPTCQHPHMLRTCLRMPATISTCLRACPRMSAPRLLHASGLLQLSPKVAP